MSTGHEAELERAQEAVKRLTRNFPRSVWLKALSTEMSTTRDTSRPNFWDEKDMQAQLDELKEQVSSRFGQVDGWSGRRGVGGAARGGEGEETESAWYQGAVAASPRNRPPLWLDTGPQLACPPQWKPHLLSRHVIPLVGVDERKVEERFPFLLAGA
eukprot:scaffold1048_cov224-Pinguiococcus_pyrenoidosus.AAC.3